jgi:predicted glycoside hydrolase/deacetylase ChbG (UPF0249 family)
VKATRYLIVNADDFGLSAGVNCGIIASHEHGIVTSASLMVRWSAAPAAADYARQHPQLSLGLHVDLCEWIYRDDTWTPLYEVVSLDDQQQIARETTQQLAAFRNLVGRNPTHLDSHQHVHLKEPTRSVLLALAREMDVPLRHYASAVRYCGDFYGHDSKSRPYPQGISVDGLIELLARLPPGVTELGCHPGEAEDLDTMYAHERRQEIATLCDPRIRAALAAEGIQLCSFLSYPQGS